jgi:hypothetical protein
MTDAELRHRLIQQTAYYDWKADLSREPHGDGQHYWLEAEKKIDKDIRAIGGVPFF